MIVVVTGGSRGLGLALSKRFVERGDRVYAVSRTKQAWLNAKKSLGDSDAFKLHQVDATQEGPVKTFIARVLKSEGRIDILINNAGYGTKLSRVEELEIQELNAALTQNLISQVLFCKHTVPIFRKQGGGTIVNVSSMAGKRAVPRLLAYSASKFAVVALSQCVAKENADTKLKCFTVCPGGINTEMRASLFGPEDASKQQTTDYVASVVMDVLDDKTHVDSGGDIVIRHGTISQINPVPSA